MEQIKFTKTGNFWLDNGIVGLYKVLINLPNLEPQDIDVQLDKDGLEIRAKHEGTEISDIINLLNIAKESVVKEYLKPTGIGWIFKEGEFETYRKTDFKMHLKSFFTGKTPRTEGALCIPETKDSDLGGKGRRMTSIEYEKFIKFKEANSPVVIDEKKYPLSGKGFINTKPQYEIGEDFTSDFLKKGKKRCILSGESYLKADTINGMNYPFLTGKSGEMNFASLLEGKPLISSMYSFVSLFSFYNLYYQRQNDLQNYFLFYDSNLKELKSFNNAIQPPISLLKNADYCNFETHFIGAEYENETLFGFIVSVYKQARQKLAKDIRKELYTKSIITFTNDGNIFRDVKEYTSLTQLFDLFDAFDETDEEKFGFETFLNLVRFFQKKIPSAQPKYDTNWRNRLCSDILNFRSIARTIEWFLGEVRLKEEVPNAIVYLDKILEVYNNKTQSHMDKEMIKRCKSIGTTIGIYSQKEEDKGVLFSLRNAKNRIEFLKSLSFIQFKIVSSEKIEDQYKLKIYDDFFEGLPDTPQWEEYKSLISIFAMNSFLYRPSTQNQ